MHAPELFKALSDPTRLRCLSLLVSADELCVCELTYALGLPQPRVSHHLAALRRTALVSDRKVGLWIYYRLNPELPTWIVEVIRTTAQGISSKEPYAGDLRTLSEMPDRPGSACVA
jgi:ArsR family transcriptional regulator, arsenate/arsenite/antimonite-responsive transcriptional repressor